MWLGDLCRGLCWQRTSVYPCPRVDPKRGPSWSWVNFDSEVHFLRDTVLESYIEVIEDKIDLKGTNSFGEVLGGKLVLRAKVMDLSFSLRKSLRRTENPLFTRIFDLDDVSEQSGIWSSRPVLMWVARTIDERPSPLKMWLPQPPKKDVIHALILRQVEGSPDTFERIGRVIIDEIDNPCD